MVVSLLFKDEHWMKEMIRFAVGCVFFPLSIQICTIDDYFYQVRTVNIAHMRMFVGCFYLFLKGRIYFHLKYESALLCFELVGENN